MEVRTLNGSIISNRLPITYREMTLNPLVNPINKTLNIIKDNGGIFLTTHQNGKDLVSLSSRMARCLWAKPKIVNSMEEAQKRVRDSISISEGYAFIGDATDIKYLELSNCDLQEVGDQFSKKPYALAVPQGSPLKDQLNDA